jgi:hypothetical protein
MPTKLRKLKITRVAVVDAGANPDADVLLFKAVAPPTSAPEDLASLVHPLDTQSDEGRSEPDGDAATPDVSKAGAVMASHRKMRLQDAIATLQALLDEATSVDMPALTDTPVAVYSKGDAPMDTTAPEHPEVLKQEHADLRKRAETAEARVKELEHLEAVAATLEATIADLKLTPDEQVAKYWAQQPEAVRKQHEADELEKADLRKRLQLADERAEQAEYIQKTAAFRSFGITPDHWNLIRAIEKKLDEPERDELLRLMKAATEQTKTAALYTSMGTTGVTNGSLPATAEDQIYALAKAYADEHKCDLGTAQLAVAAQNRELYERSVMEKRRHTRVASD